MHLFTINVCIAPVSRRSRVQIPLKPEYFLVSFFAISLIAIHCEDHFFTLNAYIFRTDLKIFGETTSCRTPSAAAMETAVFGAMSRITL